MTDPCRLRDLRELMSRYGFRTDKAKGQNFLIDPTVPERIAALACRPDVGVLEIGPGVGSLTQRLCASADHVLAIEKDKSLSPLLGETMADFDNLTILYTDALKVDYPTLLAEYFPGRDCIVCANLPYYITTPILTALLEAECFQSVTVMVQKEVAQRISALPGTAEYGAFSVFCQYYAQPEYRFDVLPESFFPQPKVTSGVLTLRIRTEPPCQMLDKAMFFRTVRAAFAQRRKTLVNSLTTLFSLPKERLTFLVTECGLPADIRGERLSLADFALLSDALLRELSQQKNQA